MELNDICVIGGGGFVGRHIVHLLAARGLRVRVPARDRERAKNLILLPTVDVIRADVHDDATLAECVRGAGAVINLVGVLHDGRGKGGFAAAHVELTRKIIAACKANGVKRYLHMRVRTSTAPVVISNRRARPRRWCGRRRSNGRCSGRRWCSGRRITF